jgi:hypothetical protein
LSDPLSVIWEHADIEDAVIDGDDVLAWPPGWLECLERRGLVRQIESARCVPCDACEVGHVEDVVCIESPPGTPMRAYILCPTEGRVNVPLERLRQWRSDFPGLASAIAGGLSLSGGVDEVVPGRIWSLGRTTIAGQSRGLFLGRGLVWPDAAGVVGSARRVLPSPQNSVVLVAGELPVREVWGGVAPAVVPLRLLMTITGDALAMDRGPLEDLVFGNRRRAPQVPVTSFPTPAGATWEQVRVRFRDGHTVSINILGEEGVFNYAQMGMASRKNAEPTVQWKLLKTLAEGRGTLTWTSPHADRRNQKRRENLGRDLRAFFGIEGDPIALTDDGRGWRVCFELHDEA